MTPQPGTTTLEFGGRTFLVESWTLTADPYRWQPETLTIRAVPLPAAPTPPAPPVEVREQDTEPEPLSFLWW